MELTAAAQVEMSCRHISRLFLDKVSLQQQSPSSGNAADQTLSALSIVRDMRLEGWKNSVQEQAV